MKIKFIHVGLAMLVLVGAYAGSLVTGSYWGRAWVDAPLHFLGGIFLGLLWLWILSWRFMKRFLESLSGPLVSISVVGFVVFGSLAWEGLEDLLRKFFPHYAAVLGFNSVINDIASDLVFGFLGGLVVATIYFSVSKKKSIASTNSA